MSLNQLRLEDNAPWKQRYRVSTIASAQAARSNPLKGIIASNATGQYQLYAWSISNGALRQLTYNAGGTLFGTISPDGDCIYYLLRDRGNKTGHPFMNKKK